MVVASAVPFVASLAGHQCVDVSPKKPFGRRVEEGRGIETLLEPTRFPSPLISRVEGWRHCSSGSAYLLLSVSVESASLAEP